MRDSTELARGNEGGVDKDTLALLGGVAMVVFGAGLIISSRSIRTFIGNVRPGELLAAAIPDFEKYMKLRAM